MKEIIRRYLQNAKEFLTDVKGELMKVTYPTSSETIGSTTVVIVLSIIVSLFLVMVDSVLVRVMRILLE